MEHYVGLDVALKQTSICVVSQTGSVMREGVVDSDPEVIAAFVRSKAPGALTHRTNLGSFAILTANPPLVFGEQVAFSHRGQRKAPVLIARIVFYILIFVRDYLSRSRPRVQGAKAAVTRDHVRDAFPNRAVLAVPVHVSA
jgi:hypothetical protein